MVTIPFQGVPDSGSNFVSCFAGLILYCWVFGGTFMNLSHGIGQSGAMKSFPLSFPPPYSVFSAWQDVVFLCLSLHSRLSASLHFLFLQSFSPASAAADSWLARYTPGFHDIFLLLCKFGYYPHKAPAIFGKYLTSPLEKPPTPSGESTCSPQMPFRRVGTKGLGTATTTSNIHYYRINRNN